MSRAEVAALRAVVPEAVTAEPAAKNSSIAGSGALAKLCRFAEAMYPDLRLNEMTGQTESPVDPAQARLDLESAIGGDRPPKKEDVKDALRIVALTRRYNPLQDHINGLPEWDGVPRLSRWLITYGKASAADYVEVIGRKWLISAIARGLRPGCQVDYTLVVQGPQRTGKTSALRIIGGSFYRSMTGKAIGSKDTKHELRGAWIAEFADLGALPRTEVNVIKGFLTDTHDSYTWKYETTETVAARSCVFSISDNPDGAGWLSDTTGAFRFWPIVTGTWDLDGLTRDRDQLLAEALAAYQENEPWWPDFHDPAMAELCNQQASLQQFDEWQTIIAEHSVVGTNVFLPLHRVLTDVLGIEVGKITKSDQMRAGKALKSLGWVREKRRDGTSTAWVWRRP